MTSCKSFIPAHQVRGRREGLPLHLFDPKPNNQAGPAESKDPRSPSSSWKPLSPLLSPSDKGYRDFESDPIDRSIYPSPPSTSLQPGRSVPLPNAFCGSPGVLESRQTFESYNHSLGPHSPPNLERKALNFREPLSPPPTLPTQTLSLPPAEQDLTSFEDMQIDHDMDLQSLSLNLPVTGDDGANYHLLSPPLSPEGTYEKSDDSSFSLSQPHPFFPDTSSSPLLVGHEIPGQFQDGHSSHFPNFPGPHSSQRLWLPPTNFAAGQNFSKPPDTISITSYFSTPQPWYLPENVLDADRAPWDYLEENMTTSGPLHILTPQNLDNASHALSPPFYPCSPPMSSPASSDHEFDYHDYDDGLAVPFSLPSSPSLRSFSELPMVEDDDSRSPALDDDHYPFGDTRPVPLELSQTQDNGKAPTIRSFPGVDTDDDLIPLDLASRSSAPEHCIIIPSTPYITPSTFLPLSSTAYSDDIGNSAIKFDGGGLLLHDTGSSEDAPDVAGAELDHLNPMLVASDPELKRLLDLRKRVLASEKRVGMVEDQYKKIKASWLRDTRKGVEGEDGHDHQAEESRAQTLLAMQAKKARKAERVKLGELNALIKIKLKQKGVSFEQERPSVKNEDMDSDSLGHAEGLIHDSDTEEMAATEEPHKCGHQTKVNKDNLTSMPQLVARMMLRRREARLRPLKTGCGRSDRGTSSAAPGRAARRRRGSLLAHAAPPNRGQGRASDGEISPSDALLSCNEHHDSDYSSLHWHMDIDCHACPDSAISSLDDLDFTSPFKMLSLSDM